MLTNTRHTDAGQSHRGQTGGSQRTRNALRPRVLLATTVVAAVALIGSPMANAFIMSDGRICDPIRHMGC